MKKLIAVVLAACLMFSVTAFACEEDAPIVPPVREEYAAPFTYDDDVWVALTAEYHELAKITDPNKIPEEYPIQNVEKVFVRGFSDHGMIGVSCRISIVEIEETVVGLTRLNDVTVAVDEDKYEITESIIQNMFGEGTCVNARSIFAATLWRIKNTVSHIFFPEKISHFRVAEATFNGGRNTTIIYAGDFDGNGTLELGFAAGWFDRTPEPVVDTEPEPETTPAPAPDVTPAPTSSTSVKVEVNCERKESTKAGNCSKVVYNQTVNNTIINVGNFKDTTVKINSNPVIAPYSKVVVSPIMRLPCSPCKK